MTIYLTEKQIEKINALAIQRYSPNEKIQTVSSSALNMIVNLPEQFACEIAIKVWRNSLKFSII